MAAETLKSQVTKRSWVVLLYFYLAALVGLGFVITGLTLALFGAKTALLPGLNLPRYTYEFSGPPDSRTPPEQRQAAKYRAIVERRGSGLDDMLSGLIIVGIGTPVLVWHIKRGRALSAGAEKPDGTTAPTPPAPPQAPAA